MDDLLTKSLEECREEAFLLRKEVDRLNKLVAELQQALKSSVNQIEEV